MTFQDRLDRYGLTNEFNTAAQIPLGPSAQAAGSRHQSIAVANGAASRSGIENALRRSLRDERESGDHHAPIEVDVPERKIVGPKTTKQDLYELARKIASQKAGRRYYRNDVISEAYLAVAKGKATDKRGIENAVRRARRSEWKQQRRLVYEDRRGEWNDEDGHVPFDIENISGWGPPGAPERARPDLYAALSALTEKQQTAVFLIYWQGLTQRQTADAMGVDQTVVRDHLRAAIRAMKKFLTAPPKTSSKNAVGI